MNETGVSVNISVMNDEVAFEYFEDKVFSEEAEANGQAFGDLTAEPVNATTDNPQAPATFDSTTHRADNTAALDDLTQEPLNNTTDNLHSNNSVSFVMERWGLEPDELLEDETAASLQVQGSGFRVQGSGLRVDGCGLRVEGCGLRVAGSGFRVQGSGFRVQG